ncbi:MAG: (2Fe-2S)-binding protein [Corynebacterium sp.]|uniref:(2Fe-2S)-binding protein n=1 Tax=Corynebacterium sp. TaxID=1720 RepID=UPI0026DBAF26|nr:(2Fe-2S)-binding protein [Corynebacterium sp.]MDO4762208.1 (2Fe-2S)-binding protein [Corynebacterium sp.]
MSVDAALAQVLRTIPRYEPCVDSERAHEVLTTSQLCTPETLGKAFHASQDLFDMPDIGHAAQVWLFSLMGSVASPSVAAMVLTDSIPDLGWGSGLLFSRDDQGYWFGFRPHALAADYETSAHNVGMSLAPVIESICTLTGIRPAPLWAVAADGLIQPAIGAGNEDFEQLKALDVATRLHAGLQQATSIKLPAPRFDQIVDGEIVPIAAGEEPDYVIAHRASCCMIYHSPSAEFCTSCPRQPKEKRYAGLIAAAEMY